MKGWVCPIFNLIQRKMFQDFQQGDCNSLPLKGGSVGCNQWLCCGIMMMGVCEPWAKESNDCDIFPQGFYKTPWSVLGGQEWGIWMIQTLKLLFRRLGLSKLELHKETRFFYRLQVSYFLECWSYKDRTMSWCRCSLSYLLL